MSDAEKPRPADGFSGYSEHTKDLVALVRAGQANIFSYWNRGAAGDLRLIVDPPVEAILRPLDADLASLIEILQRDSNWLDLSALTNQVRKLNPELAPYPIGDEVSFQCGHVHVKRFRFNRQ